MTVQELIDGTDWGLPLPVPDEVSEEWFSACARGTLLVQYCESCGQSQHYPRAWCTSCGSETVWRESSGQGVIYSFTVIRQMRAQPFKDRLPYVVAVIDLPEGVRMMGNILDVDPNAVEIGSRVTVCMVKVTDTIALPVWKLSN